MNKTKCPSQYVFFIERKKYFVYKYEKIILKEGQK